MVQPGSTTEDFVLNSNETFRRAAFVVLFLAMGQFILQVGLLLRGVEYVAASLTIDDTYYYLQTAWNTRQLGFVTFDGLHSTNGVQFLWFVIILLLAMVANTKIVLLFATMVVSFLLNGLCYLIILKIGAHLETIKSGPIHGWPVVTPKPSFQNIFDGNGKFITCIGLLVRHMAERYISGSGAESG